MRIPSINDIVYTRPVPRHCISADPSFSLLAVADVGEELSAGCALCMEVWEHTPPGNVWNLGHLRWILVQSTHLCNRPSENSI